MSDTSQGSDSEEYNLYRIPDSLTTTDFEILKKGIKEINSPDGLQMMKARDEAVKTYFGIGEIEEDEEIEGYEGNMYPPNSSSENMSGGGDDKGYKSNILVSIGFGIAVIFSTVLIGSAM